VSERSCGRSARRDGLEPGGDLSFEVDDLRDDDLQRGDEREHDLPSVAGLGLAGATRGG
jgi:hypothetical protein